jgi:hypothetical protein
VSSDHLPAAGSHGARPPAEALEIDLAVLAGTIREQTALPLTDSEVDAVARSLEAGGSDEELLTNTLGMLRLLVGRLEPRPPPIDGGEEPGRET